MNGHSISMRRMQLHIDILNANCNVSRVIGRIGNDTVVVQPKFLFFDTWVGGSSFVICDIRKKSH